MKGMTIWSSVWGPGVTLAARLHEDARGRVFILEAGRGASSMPTGPCANTHLICVMIGGHLVDRMQRA